MKSDDVRTVTAIGFGYRLAATLLDVFFVGLLGMLLGTAAGVAGLFLGLYTADRPLALNLLIIGSMLIFSVVYYVASWVKGGQTFGKMTLGIKVVGADGAPPSWGKAILRYIGYIINGLVFSLGFLWIVFDPKRQGWHDKIAGTYVVYEEDEFTQVDAVKLVPREGERRWLWVLLWVLLAISIPGSIGGLWALGPFMAKVLSTFVSGLQ